MKRLLALLSIVVATSAFAPQSSTATKAFEKLKTLVGTWKGDAMGSPVEVTYKLTGAGSALIETQFPGTAHEMVTVYHMDQDSLVLTHYCAAGNQPTMKLSPGKEASVLSFDFLKGSNMKAKDLHMHSVKIKFLGADQIESDWTSYVDGKSAGTVVFKLKRVDK